MKVQNTGFGVTRRSSRERWNDATGKDILFRFCSFYISGAVGGVVVYSLREDLCDGTANASAADGFDDVKICDDESVGVHSIKGFPLFVRERVKSTTTEGEGGFARGGANLENVAAKRVHLVSRNVYDFLAARRESVDDGSTLRFVGDRVEADDRTRRSDAHHDVSVIDDSAFGIRRSEDDGFEIFRIAIFANDIWVRPLGECDKGNGGEVIDDERAGAFEELGRIRSFVHQERIVDDEMRVLELEKFDDVLATFPASIFILHRKEFDFPISHRVPIVRKHRVRGVVL